MGKPIGSRGDWFAKWQGESFPCVHKCWYRVTDKRSHYFDPYVTDDPKWKPFIQSIKDRKVVILTDDDLDPSGMPVKRKSKGGYIGLYRVDNVVDTGTELRFDFIERIEDFS